MAALCRRSESRSVPTLAAELVRKYATAGVRTLAMHHAARLPAPLCRPKTTVHGAPLVVESQPAAVREGARTTSDGGKQAILAPAWEPVSGCSTSPLVRNHDAGNELQGGRPEAHLRFKFVCFVFKMQANGETRHSSQREMSLPLSWSVTLASWSAHRLTVVSLSDAASRPLRCRPGARGPPSHPTARLDERQECRLICRRFAACR